MLNRVFQPPGLDCIRCPRLVKFRLSQRQIHPEWHNAPVPGFGPWNASLLVVGLAPGLQGANRTGRPFTGDHAGELLYETLIEYGFATGHYDARPDDGLTLTATRITNAVRCVPPLNKPVGAEMSACREFLKNEIAALPDLRVLVALGKIAHDNILSALSIPRSSFPFRHAAEHSLSQRLVLFDSYHCSRYNTNTGRLTRDMFRMVFSTVQEFLSRPSS